MKKALKITGIILAAVVLIVMIALGVLTAAEYKPADTESLAVSSAASAVLPAGREVTLMTWNIGYGALGDNADFFMDGGTHVQTASKERVYENLAAIAETIAANAPDILCLQETDRNSTRSSRIDEQKMLTAAMPDSDVSFAYNFKALYVPYPFPPIGQVNSGLSTFSRFRTSQADRIALPCPFSWPMRIANLKRCLMVSRIPADDGTELVVINLHLEAYDAGEGKTAQSRMLAEYMKQETEKGNHVIACGDFNQYFSQEDLAKYPLRDGLWQAGILDRELFEDGFVLLTDASVPSCRSLDRPYAGADTDDFQYYMIDGFIVSKDISVTSVQTLDLGFAASDHNPVILQFSLPLSE